IDAHKLAELLYLNKLSSVYHGETGVRMLRELARSYLTIVQRSDPSHVSVESGLSQLGHPLCRPGRLLYPSSRRVAGQDQRSRRPSPRRTTLPATGHAAVLAPASAPRAVGGESQACHHRQTTADSLTGTDSLPLGGGADPDPAPFPHEATALGLQRTGFGNPYQ